SVFRLALSRTLTFLSSSSCIGLTSGRPKKLRNSSGVQSISSLIFMRPLLSPPRVGELGSTSPARNGSDGAGSILRRTRHGCRHSLSPRDRLRIRPARTGSAGSPPHRGEAGVEEGGDWDFAPDIVVTDGAEIVGGKWRFEAVHTPGHTSNHLCFALPDSGILFSGDHVMGWSTSVIAPPDGDMAAYMASL